MKIKDLDIIDNWIIIKNIKSNPTLRKSLHDFIGENIIGYVYVDYQYGITFDANYLCKFENNKFIITDNLIEKNIRILYRYDILKKTDFEFLTKNQIAENNLAIAPWIQGYETNELKLIRKNPNLDKFRAEGFPYDIQVLLFPMNGLKPELVWCRIKNETEGNETYMCNLLNEPNQDFKIHCGDNVEVFLGQIVTKEGDQIYMMCKTAMDRLKSD